jgi:hypothetical protein
MKRGEEKREAEKRSERARRSTIPARKRKKKRVRSYEEGVRGAAKTAQRRGEAMRRT